MDETNRKIIEILRSNARTTNAEIGKKVKLTEAAVRKRIKKLVETGAIRKFTVETEEGVGNLRAIVFITVRGQSPEVAKNLSDINGVEKVYELTGSHDIAVLVSAPNIAVLNQTVDKMRLVSGVANTDTKMILKEWKGND
ncbi:MAG: Lrp/AsnC family transcriptional regulator [Candidatus Micrarchaeia archaeon]